MILSGCHRPAPDQNTQLPYNQDRITLFSQLPIQQDDIVFLGDSLTDNAEWAELFPHCRVVNRGIQGNTSADIYQRIEPIVQSRAKKVFLMVGINDLLRGGKHENVAQNIKRTIEQLSKHHSHVYLQSVLYTQQNRKINQQVTQLNLALEQLARTYQNTHFINLNMFLAEQDHLKKIYTNDGLHLNGRGYMQWKIAIQPYIDGTN